VVLETGEPLVPPLAPSLRAVARRQPGQDPPLLGWVHPFLAQLASRRAEPGSGGSWDRSRSGLTGWRTMAISRDEVVHVARLARLELTDEELDRFAGQLDAILEAVGKVSELDLSQVEPTLHPLALSNVWAEDEPRPSLEVEEALANAPDREDDAFRVPPA
jgi:aspartyl-tRNA(Asn)/glutamyl-tRNA(Gln) amidotransferase subunit C